MANEKDDAAGGGGSKAGSTDDAAKDPAVVAALKALPDPTLTPVSGTATADEKSGFVTELVAYAALDNALGPVANRVGAAKPAGVLVVEDRALLASTWAYTGIVGEVGRFEGMLDVLDALVVANPPKERPVLESDEQATGRAAAQRRFDLYGGATAAAGALLANPALAAAVTALGAAPKVLGAAADVLGMFRTEYAFTGRTMSPQGTPLVAETARLLADRGVPVVVDGFDAPRESPLLQRLATLRSRWHDLLVVAWPLRAQVAADTASVTKAQTFLAQVEKKVVDTAAAGPVPDSLTEVRAHALAAVAEAQRDAAEAATIVALVDQGTAALDAFLTAVVTAPQGGGHPPVVGALLRERLQDRSAERRVSHVLFVSLDTVGGERVDATKRLTTRDQKPLYVGGLQVSYLLLDAESGTTVAAGTHRALGRATFDPERAGLVGHRTAPVGGAGFGQDETGGTDDG